MKPSPKQNGTPLKERFSGCLLGGMIGDVIGAAVEAESAAYIQKTFRNIDQILSLKSVPELITGEWEVGRFTDDTQMTLCLAEWLAYETQLDGKRLLERLNGKRSWQRHQSSGGSANGHLLLP